MRLLFQVCALLFEATLSNAQAAPLTAMISRFGQVAAGINLDNGLVLWLDASNPNNTINSTQGNVNTWVSSHNVTQSLNFSAPSNAQAPQNFLAHSRFPGYPVFNLRFVRSLSQFYQFSPKPSQEFPTNFENGMTTFTVSALGFVGSAGPAGNERIFDFGASSSATNAFAVARNGANNNLYILYNNAISTAPAGINAIQSGESFITRIIAQPNGRMQITTSGNETTVSPNDTPLGAYNTASRTATAFIGKSNLAADALLEGSIGEILVWNRVLNSIEMRSVYSYLNAKYFGCGAGVFGAYPACTACPVNTFSSLWNATTLSQCQPCQNGSSTEGLTQCSACVFPIATISRTVSSTTATFVSIAVSPSNGLATTPTITTLAVDTTPGVAWVTLISTKTETLTTTRAPSRPQLPQTLAPPETSVGDKDVVTIVATSAAGVVILFISMLLVWQVRKGKAQVIGKPAKDTPTINPLLTSVYQPSPMPFSGTPMQLSQFPTQLFQQGSMQRPAHLSQSPTQLFQQGSMQRPAQLSQSQTQLFQQGSMQRPAQSSQSPIQPLQQGFINHPTQFSLLSPYANTTLASNRTSFFTETGRGSTTRNSMLNNNTTRTLATATPTMQF